MADRAWIYFVQHPTTLEIKIGCSRNPRARIVTLRHETKAAVALLGMMNGDEREESRLHERFGHIRAGAEWFRPEPDLLEYIAANAKPSTEGKRSRGRPQADGPRVAVRMTFGQHDALERVARAAGIPLSTYMREAALQKAGLAALGIAGEAARLAAGGTAELSGSNIRYVVTHVNVERTLRVLTRSTTGRDTFATFAEAQEWIDASAAELRRILFHGASADVRVTAVECWPGHNDPKRAVWGLDGSTDA